MRLGDFGILSAAGVVAALLTGFVLRHATLRGRVDVANPRSSHTLPTPRGGGLAIVLVSLCAAVYAVFTARLTVGDGMVLLGGGGAVALVSHLDDVRGLSVWPRLAVHLVAAVVAATILADPASIVPHVPFAVGAVFIALIVTWSINLFNFMDGIDGLAASQAAFVSLATAGLVMLAHGPNAPAQIVPLATAGACLGFLIWNWPPARIFMGDVGSAFLGYWLAAVALWLDQQGLLSAWTVATLMAAFVADATVTLLRRAWRRDRWYAAHRSHAYQRLAQRWGDHRKVTLLLWVINVVLVLPLAALSVLMPAWAPGIAITTFSIAGLGAWVVGAGAAMESARIGIGEQDV